MTLHDYLSELERDAAKADDGRVADNALPKLLAIIKVQQKALERYENTKLYVRSGQCVVQRKNGNGEWITTVPIDAEESWCVGDHANEALAAVEKIAGG